MGMIGNSLAQGLISGANIVDGTVDTPDLKDNAVTAAKIANGVVTPGKLSTGAPSWSTAGNLLIGGVGDTGYKLNVGGNSLIVATQASYAAAFGSYMTLDSNADAGYIQSWSGKPLWLNSQGNSVLVGSNLLVGTATTTKNARLDQKLLVVGAGVSYGGMSVTGYVGTGVEYRPLIDFNRSRGTTDGSMTAVVSGDALGSVLFRGADGTNFQDAAMISGRVDGNVASGSVAGALAFYTAPAGGGVAERARIDSGGKFLVGLSSGTGFSANLVVSRYGVTGSPILTWTNATSNSGHMHVLSGNGVGITADGFLAFGSNEGGGGGFTERMRIAATGAVTIGGYGVLTASPGTENSFNQNTNMAADTWYKIGALPEQAGLYACSVHMDAGTVGGNNIYWESAWAFVIGAIGGNVYNASAEQPMTVNSMYHHRAVGEPSFKMDSGGEYGGNYGQQSIWIKFPQTTQCLGLSFFYKKLL